MPTILVSFRRDDSAACAGRLADRLREHFGAARVYQPVAVTIAPFRVTDVTIP